MTIVFFRANKVGDNVVAIQAIYAIKFLYPNANLIVLTNACGRALYGGFSFIDELLYIDFDLEKLRQREIDIFIISHRTGANIALARGTKARQIITQAHFSSIFRTRFINDYNLCVNFRKESKNLLRLVRLMDKRIFDTGIKNIDFGAAKLQSSPKNDAFVEGFLAGLEASQASESCGVLAISSGNVCGVVGGGGQDNAPQRTGQNRKLIGINIFGSNGVGHFGLEAWREIILDLAGEFRAGLFILTATNAAFRANEGALKFAPKNIAMFVNDDLANLIALTKRLDALISVDTGNVHIADSLQIPTIGLYTKRMFRRWSGGSYGGRFEGFIIEGLSSDERARLEAFLPLLKNALGAMLEEQRG